MSRKKVAFVVQRYGKEVVGGAETLARQLAEKFVTELPWDIEVLTTTALDYMTWKNHYDEGQDTLNGVSIRRFNSARGRWRSFSFIHRFAMRFFPSIQRRKWLTPLNYLLERLWLIAQGPYCPKLILHLREQKSAYDQVIYFTYLYYPTIYGYQETLPNGVVVTTAHDELPFHFDIVRKMLNEIPYIVTLNPEESKLVSSKLDSDKEKVKLAGMGIDIPKVHKTDFGEQNVLYLGRISRGKGVANLIEWMTDFQDVKLNLAGKVESDLKLEENDQVKYHGFVSEEQKGKLIDNASVLINPSAHESLSIIVLEAMARGRPVIVNGNCSVLNHYALETQTVFSFTSKEEFKELLRRVLSIDWSANDKQSQLKETVDWVSKYYSWPAITRTYSTLTDKQN